MWLESVYFEYRQEHRMSFAITQFSTVTSVKCRDSKLIYVGIASIHISTIPYLWSSNYFTVWRLSYWKFCRIWDR